MGSSPPARGPPATPPAATYDHRPSPAATTPSLAIAVVDVRSPPSASPIAVPRHQPAVAPASSIGPTVAAGPPSMTGGEQQPLATSNP